MTAPDNNALHSGDREFGLAYVASLATEKQTSIGELQNATTWGLTVATTGLVFLAGRSGFPDEQSLLGCAVLLVFVAHFMVRAMKGYANVLRWSLLQRILIADLLQPHRTGISEESRAAIATYHGEWKLPVRRTTVVWKGMFELAFGYLLVASAGLMVYILTAIPWKWGFLPVVLVSVVASVAELLLFATSPYMKYSRPIDEAQRYR